jgi:hypothetical protein
MNPAIAFTPSNDPNEEAEIKRQKAKGKRQKCGAFSFFFFSKAERKSAAILAFCLLPFAFCLSALRHQAVYVR